MAKKRKTRQPTDPAEAARRAYETRRNPAMWGVNEGALQSAQNADVRSEAETRTRTRRVQRFDCFATLNLSLPAFQAVRRYQADLAESYGVGDRDTLSEYVDGGGARELVSSRSMAASNRVAALYRELRTQDAALLIALSVPAVVEGRQPNWHMIVKTLRGLIDRGSQASAVKTLSEAVREGYSALDNMTRRAA
jgi:hypothetical protein